MVNNTPPASTVAFSVLDGVSASRVHITAAHSSVLDFLCLRFPAVDEATWRHRFARQRVLDSQGKPLDPANPCQAGEQIYYYRELPAERHIPFHEQILFQDEHLLVADKPHFLPVTPVGRFVQESLLVRLKRSTGIDTLTPIHRIDKDTAGLVLFSVNPDTRDAYQRLFRERAMHKTYRAIAPLLLDQHWPHTRHTRLEDDVQFFRSREVPGEPNSETRIQLVQTHDTLGLYALYPTTGRKHQLRVHLAALGAPILNDPLYPVVRVRHPAPDDFTHPLQLLAHALAFDDPVTHQPRQFVSQQALVFPPTTPVLP